jgi:threonine synthase
MKTLFKSIRCLECGHDMQADLYAAHCDACGGAWLDAEYDYASLPRDWPASLLTRPADMWRYGEFLPFPDHIQPVSVSEGWTPLIRASGLERELNHDPIWIKDERRQPTGSFKDRQAAFTISALKAQGVDELVLASTGNAAAAYAAYCARAGIKLWVFLPSSVPAEKMRELALYGAEVVKVTGTYDQTKHIAADFAARRGIMMDRGAKAIPGKESMKTIAFEIVEQLGWQAPDWYVQAVSGGIGPLGVLKGFTDLHAVGLIDHIPKIGVVQVEGCAPMVRAWEQGLAQAEPVQPDTLVIVLATGDPGPPYRILKEANDRNGGAMVAVSDGDAFRAMRRLARLEGFSMEPAASVAFAGLDKMLAEGHIQPGECVVVNCSGHTFSAEKHALEDRHMVHLEMETPAALDGQTLPVRIGGSGGLTKDGVVAALEQLDEQITSIVIIEDNPHDSRLIRRLLQSYKRYRIFEAHNGLDGLDLVRQRRPDLVMLDLTMPEMDGFAVLGALKADERTCDIPVVIISAKTLTSDEWRYLRRHARSIWQKGGFSARELASHVVETLGDEVSELETRPAGSPATACPTAIPALGEASPWGAAGPGLAAGQPGSQPIEAFGQLERPRILVVDDNVWDSRLMRRLFAARQRYDVVEAHSAAEAMQAIEQAVPDLILLDLKLPDVSGEELLQKLRAQEETRDVPVVVVSAKDIDATLRIQLVTHADSVWSKGTLDRSSLLAHIETILAE